MEEKQNWELQERYQKLESKKTLLTKLDEKIPWQEFRPLLEKIHNKPRKSNAGRKPIDVEENQQLAMGEIPETWTEKPHRLSQKDIDVCLSYPRASLS
jgi:hypothetical protein